MDGMKGAATGGSLQISKEVIAHIAQLATLEVDGVHSVFAPAAGIKGLFGKAGASKPIVVELTEDVAEITVHIVVNYGCKVPPLCVRVQENVKSSVQNMTSITVSRVNVIIAGVSREVADAAEAE